MIFCFKQMTAYEMRISDWSSDVCSSDLNRLQVRHLVARHVGALDQDEHVDALVEDPAAERGLVVPRHAARERGARVQQVAGQLVNLEFGVDGHGVAALRAE